jgi:hypothetical protein
LGAHFVQEGRRMEEPASAGAAPPAAPALVFASLVALAHP